MQELLSKLEVCIAFLVAFLIAISIILGKSSTDDYTLLKSTAKRGAVSENPLELILQRASYEGEKTVILAPLNKAWAMNGSMVDYFLRSFHQGNATKPLLEHVVLIALDKAAYQRCLNIHKHCYMLETEGVDLSAEKLFMSNDYLNMMRQRIKFLVKVLQLGYSFIFTDVDVLWFRDPWKHLRKDMDFEISCDAFNGNEYDFHNNIANTGFIHVRASNATIELYKFWHRYSLIYLTLHDQGVFNKIKNLPDFRALGVKIRFLATKYFSNFCQLDTRDMKTMVTMHANCCKGLSAKLADLDIIAKDWQEFISVNPDVREQRRFNFSAPDNCNRSWKH